MWRAGRAESSGMVALGNSPQLHDQCIHPAMPGVRDLFNLKVKKANHTVSLVTKAPAGWKGEKDVCFPVGVFGVAPADPTLDWRGPPDGDQGWAGCQGCPAPRLGHGWQEELLPWGNVQVPGVLTLCLGRAHCCVWSCPSVS